jgi:hypothetical protein
MKQKHDYLAALEQLVRALYADGDGRDKSQKWALALAHTRGFAQAGRVIGLVDGEEIQEVIDRIHLEVFGESRLARRERLDGVEAKAGRKEWDDFDSPAYERYRSKT